MCYIEVASDGKVSFGKDSGSYQRALAGESRMYAVWPGQWSSDLFVIDDLDHYARAFGIVHDVERTGLAEHEHKVNWSISPYEDKPRASYISIEFKLDCGCKIRDLGSFARHMRQQKGWDIATSGGWGSSTSDGVSKYSLRVRRKSLDS
jgi:hypothetical protein